MHHERRVNVIFSPPLLRVPPFGCGLIISFFNIASWLTLSSIFEKQCARNGERGTRAEMTKNQQSRALPGKTGCFLGALCQNQTPERCELLTTKADRWSAGCCLSVAGVCLSAMPAHYALPVLVAS